MAIEDKYIKDVPITKGTLVVTMSRGNHYNQKYSNNLNVFRPERWNNECEGIHPLVFAGFSAGLRSYIGKQLAHLVYLNEDF
jgi:cytochrome P450